jgi:hypothetical protein
LKAYRLKRIRFGLIGHMLNKFLEVEGTSTVANAKSIVAEMDKTQTMIWR